MHILLAVMNVYVGLCQSGDLCRFLSPVMKGLMYVSCSFTCHYHYSLAYAMKEQAFNAYVGSCQLL